MKTLETYLRLAGLLHFAILIGSVLVPGALNWRENLARLHPFLRQLFWVYGCFIVLMIVSFGTLTLLYTGELATGSNLARGVCATVCVFWFARLIVQFFVFDPEPFLTHWIYRVGYHGLTFVFAYFVFIYGWAALQK